MVTLSQNKSVLAGLKASAFTFKRGTPEKLAYIILNLIDLGLTLFALSIGAHEYNPLLRSMANSPFQLYGAKLLLPSTVAWILPGKLLIPAVAFLLLVVGWDIRELVLYFH